jgi:hypothetical protein
MASSRPCRAAGVRAACFVLALAVAGVRPARAGERLDLSSGWPDTLRQVGKEEGVAIGGLAVARPRREGDRSPAESATAPCPGDVPAGGRCRSSNLARASRRRPSSSRSSTRKRSPSRSLVTTLTQRSVARVRPFLSECATNPRDPQCSGSLYGSADAVVCPTALGLAAALSLLRVVADRHWTTDVIGGALVGSTFGTVVSAVHLRVDGAARDAGLSLGGEGRSMMYWRRF